MEDQIAQLEHLFPRWHVWQWNGMLYARRLKTSPPPVVKAADADGLAEKIRHEEERPR